MRNTPIRHGLCQVCAWGLVSLALATPAGAKTTPLPNPCSLLTAAQLVPALGGKATSANSGSRYSRACRWTGPPQGYMEFSQQLMISVNRETRAQFAMHAYRDIPKPDPLPGVGSEAFASSSGFEIWQNGFELDLEGPYTTVDPSAAKRLALSALERLANAT